MPTKKLSFAAGGLGTWSHSGITEWAIMPLYREFFGLQHTNDNHAKALANIIKWNANTDFSSEFYLSAPHADGENFYGAQERLKTFKTEVANLMAGAPSNARILNAQHYLGRALHTLQDFYSHSNWVEEQLTEPIEPFHALGDLNTTLFGLPPNEKTCKNCARNTCSQCEDILDTSLLTSGYYGSDSDNKKPGPWKCSHGGLTALGEDTSGLGLKRSGINKDTKDCTVSPHEQYHPRAARTALLATQEYLREIKDIIGLSKMSALLGGSPRLAFVVDTTGSMSSEIASVRQQILQIIDARVSLGLATNYVLIPFNDPFVGTITTTDDPDIFRNAVNALGASGGGDCPEPINQALIRAFGEMGSGGNILLFTDATASDSNLVLSVGDFARSSGIRLTSVFSGGFNDCGTDPGLFSLSFDTGGQLFSLSPSEVGLISHLGDFLALPDEVDLFSTFGFLSAQDQTYAVPVDSTLTRMVLSVSGTGATNVVVRRPDNSIVQPTDPNVSQIAVSSGVLYAITTPMVGTWSVTISGASGEEEAMVNQIFGPLADHSGENNFNDSESGPSNRFEAPTTIYAASPVQEPQQFSIRVAGESTIDVASFDFVEVAARRPGHEGETPIMGSPTSGRLTSVTATLDAEGANTAVVQLRSLDGVVLQTLNLQEIPWPGDSEEIPEPRLTPWKDYFADVTVPSVPFQVYVTGQDVNGNSYQRLVPGVIRPQTVEIIAPPLQNLHPGQSLSYNLQVKNSGPADTFQLTGIDDQNYLAGMNPTSIALGTNETKNVKVQITVPTNAESFTLDTFRFNVKGDTAQNSAVVGPLTVNPVPALALGAFTVTPIGGDGDAFLDPGEGGTLNFQLINNGANAATNVRAGLSTSTPEIVISQGNSNYPTLGPAASGTNLSPFVFYLPPNISCGQTIDFTLSVSSEGNGFASEGEYHVSISTGESLPPNTVTQSYIGPAVAIPDNDPAGVNVPITVSGVSGTIDDLNFRIDGTSCTTAIGATTVGIDHTWVADLVVKLRSPSGTEVNLINAVGGDGNNFCNTFLDDQSVGNSIQSVTSANAPFTGSFKPNNFLNAYRGENPNGVWTLNVSDTVASDVGNVRAFSLIVRAVQFSCNSAPADTTAPSCSPTDFRPGPPAAGDITTQDTGTGLAAINVIGADNVNVSVPTFTVGTTGAVVVTGTLINPNVDGSFEIQSIDVAGNVSSCSRTVTGSSVPPPILGDDFNDNSIDTAKWTTNSFTQWTNLLVPITESAQQLKIGPLIQIPVNAYTGLRTVNSFNFTGANSYIELVQAPSSTTDADALFDVGNNANMNDISQARYYRIYVRHGTLIGERRTSPTVKTTLFSIPYDPVAHRFLRIRHNAGAVTLDTAPATGGVPGTWVQRYTEAWHSAIPLTSVLIEFRGGTFKQETNPGTVIFDNFVFSANSP